MPWEEKTVNQSRSEFVIEAIEAEYSFSKLCEKYKITRKTGYKWLNRYKSGETLSNQSRKPFHSPNKTPDKTEKLILNERSLHPVWGARKLKKSLENKGFSELPSTSTISDILKRNNCISNEESQKHKPYIRFEKEKPNQLWQVDFKGDFAMLDNLRCYPLTVLDDHSRFNLAISAKLNQQGIGVFKTFTYLFNEYGIPDCILSDNGNPWGNSQCTGFTRFEIWLMQLDILPIHGRPRHPQTQGKEERFHRTMKAELLMQVPILNIKHAQEKFDIYRNEYNNERPHEALGLDVPAQHYKASTRKFSAKVESFEYSEPRNLRKIRGNGYITYRSKEHYLSEALIGEYVNLVPSSVPNQMKVQYRNFNIARIDLDKNKVIDKRIYPIKP